MAEKPPKQPIIGLARLPKGTEFRCRTCEYFAHDICRNLRSELYGIKVDDKPNEYVDCCDFYDRPGMRVRIP